MKKKTIAACLLAATAGASQAQSNVTIYGLVDTGVEHVSNVGAAGLSLTRMPSLTASLPSRIGFRGTEDLGGGLKVVYTLENGFGVDTGTAGYGGRLFGRQAFVGLSGDWGTVSIGRQYTMLFWSLLDSDILGPGIYSSAAVDSYIPNARADNALSYRGTFQGLTLGATYSLGRDAVATATPGPSSANCLGENAASHRDCREWSVLAKYDTPVWGVALARDQFNGGAGAFAGLVSGALTDRRTTVNGFVKVAALKIGGGLIRRKNDASPTPRSDLYFLGGAYPVTPAVIVDGELFQLKVKDSANRATLVALRATYSLSKRTAAYVTAGHVNNKGSSAISVSAGAPGSNPAPGQGQQGVMLGLRHAF